MRTNRREFLAATGAAPMLAQSPARAQRPNVLVILTDDQGYGDFSCLGNPILKTPAMDKLHAESVRFTDFHVAPMCTPTRGQLLTGQDALRNRATSVTAGRAVVRRGIPTAGDIFQSNGYATGVFGKWHIGDNYPYRPMDRGFQEAKYFFGWGLSSAPEFDNDYFNGRYRHNGVEKDFQGYCTDFWFDEAMAWMKRQKQASKPFFCYLPTNTPHGPAWVADKYAAPYKGSKVPANFFGMIANLDENMARLDAFLKDNGLLENTIVILMTDNGGTAGVPVYNAGMRARKTQIYNGGHRVPCWVRWPAGGMRPVGDIDVPTQNQDILPTLIDLCSLKKPANATFDGRSLAGLLRGKTDFPKRMLVVQYGQILKKWDSCVINGKWHLVKGEELYNLDADPGQTKDVAADNPQVKQAMREHYEQWWKGVESSLNEYQPISVGAPQENPVFLSSSDWQDIYCDNVHTVLAGGGGPQGGPWHIDVEREGEYEIALARWPFSRGLGLTEPCPPKKVTVAELEAGKALPIAQAQLRVAGQQLSAKAVEGAKSITFNVRLAKGKTKMHGWFQDAAGQDVGGAYYARVHRL